MTEKAVQGLDHLRKTRVEFDERPQSAARERSRVWLFLSVCVGCTALWFVLLANRPLYDPDEGRYAEIPREMLATGDWVIPHLDGLAYIEKPPLQYWLTALSFRWLGESDLAARLCPGIAGYLSLVFVYLLGRRLWGEGAGVKAVALTGASLLFVLLGHQLTLDMLLSCCLLACLCCYLCAQAERHRPRHCDRWMLAAWAAMALAVLTKGLIGILIPCATLAAYAMWQKDWRSLRTLNVRWGLPLCGVIAAPWFVMAARANDDFLDFFFVREHLLRYLTPIEHRSEPWWFFILVLAVGILPWAPLAVTALIATWRKGEPRGRFDPSRVLWVWCAFIFLFFSASNSKLVTYILPLIPALALLCARPAATDGSRIKIGAIVSVAASIGIIAYASGLFSSPSNVRLAAEMAFGLSLTAGVLAAASILSLVLLLRSTARNALMSLCCGWFLAAGGLLISGSEAEASFSAKDAADWVRAQVPPDATLYSVQFYEQSLAFYLKQTLVLVDYRDEFAFGLDENPQRGIARLDEFSRRWRRLADGYALMRPQTRDLLAAEGLPMREMGRYGQRVLVSRR